MSKRKNTQIKLNSKVSKAVKASSLNGPSYGSGFSAYDAVQSRGRRRQVVTNNSSEDALLKRQGRDKLVSNARHLTRNASVVQWARRRHLDNVATFTFQCRSGNKELDYFVEYLIGDWWARPFNCDASGRHDLYNLIRLMESLKTTDGDVLIYKLTGKDKDDPYRGTLQLIEADRIRQPADVTDYNKTLSRDYQVDPKDFVNGVRVDQYGKALAYAICDRVEGLVNGGYVLRELVSAADVLFYGECERYDQVRGVSSFASAINTFFDLYEAADYALAKMKLSQILGLKFKRGADSVGGDGYDYAGDAPDGTGSVGSGTGGLTPAEANAIVTGQACGVPAASGYSFDFGGGPQALDLDPGDDADFMTVSTPSNEFQSFFEQGLILGLKALDIPYSFYNESFTNYSGARQALLQYEQAAEQKREKLRVVLHNLTVWRLSLFIADGVIVLPDGMRISDLNFKWVGAPLPWIDPLKEASANKIMVDNKLTSRTRICAANGQDWFEIMDELEAEEKYAADLGLTLNADAALPEIPPDEPLPTKGKNNE